MSTRLQDKTNQYISANGTVQEGTVKRVYADNGVMIGRFNESIVARPLSARFGVWKGFPSRAAAVKAFGTAA